MELPLGFGSLDFGEWVYGLTGAFIGGGASAVTSGFVVVGMDPKDYNLNDGLPKLLSLMSAMFVVNGIMSMMMFLRQKPVPDHKQIRTTVQETTVEPAHRSTAASKATPETKVVTTVEETKVVPTKDEGDG